jgi:hypothetical protein
VFIIVILSEVEGFLEFEVSGLEFFLELFPAVRFNLLYPPRRAQKDFHFHRG